MRTKKRAGNWKRQRAGSCRTVLMRTRKTVQEWKAERSVWEQIPRWFMTVWVSTCHKVPPLAPLSCHVCTANPEWSSGDCEWPLEGVILTVWTQWWGLCRQSKRQHGAEPAAKIQSLMWIFPIRGIKSKRCSVTVDQWCACYFFHLSCFLVRCQLLFSTFKNKPLFDGCYNTFGRCNSEDCSLCWTSLIDITNKNIQEISVLFFFFVLLFF